MFFKSRCLAFQDIDALCDILAKKVQDFSPEVVVSIETGGWYVGDRLARQLSVPHRSITIRRSMNLAKWYNLFPKVLRIIPILWHMLLFLMLTPVMVRTLDAHSERELKGMRVLLVDDAMQSGKTFAVATCYLHSLSVGALQTATISSVWGRHVDHVCLRGIRRFPWSRSSPEFARFQEIHPS